MGVNEGRKWVEGDGNLNCWGIDERLGKTCITGRRRDAGFLSY